MYYVYLLKLKNGDYYAGVSDRLKERLNEHITGQVDSTKNFRPLSLECYIALKDKTTALKLEKYLKTGSGIAFRNKHLI